MRLMKRHETHDIQSMTDVDNNDEALAKAVEEPEVDDCRTSECRATTAAAL